MKFKVNHDPANKALANFGGSSVSVKTTGDLG